MSSKPGSRPGSRSEQPHSGSKSEPARPNSTSPKNQKKSAVRNGEPRTKADPTPNGSTGTSRKAQGDSKTISRSSSSSSVLEGVKRSPSTARRLLNPAVTKPGSRGGGASIKKGDEGGGDKSLRTSGVDASRQKNSRSPTGERKPTSVVERKPSPLAQRKVAPGNSSLKKSPDEGKVKNPTHKSSPGTPRRASTTVTRSTRTGVTQAVNSKGKERSSPSLTYKQVSPGKPPSGAHSPSGTKLSSSVKLSPHTKTTNGSKSTKGASEKATEPKSASDDGDKPGSCKTPSTCTSPVEEKVRKTSSSSGSSSVSGKKTLANSEKKLAANDGSSSDHKLSVDKKPRSAGNSPATVRRASTMKRPGGSGGGSPQIVRRSSTLRRTGSSGCIPISHKTSTERKAESVSPKIERKTTSEKKTAASSSAKKASSTGPKSERLSKEKNTGPTTGNRSSVDKKGSELSGKKTTNLNPTGRRSLQSHSVVSLNPGVSRKNDTQRKISAGGVKSPIGRGSPSPNTLAGKVVVLDHSDLQDERRLKSTLKLFGAKGSAPKVGGVKKAGKGPVIKPMGGAPSASGRRTPVKKVTSPPPPISPSANASVPTITRTGSGSVVGKSEPPSNVRERRHSSDDILKTAGLNSPVEDIEASPKRRLLPPTPVDFSSEAEKSTIGTQPSDETQENTVEKESVPANTESSENEKLVNPALANLDGKGGIVTRPSCRNTQVKSRIATWAKIGEEAKKSSLPPSPRSPLPVSPHAASFGKSSSPSPSGGSSSHPSRSASPKIPLSTSPPLSSTLIKTSLPTTSPTLPTTSSPASHSPSPSTSTSETGPANTQQTSSPEHVPSSSVKSRIAMWTEKEKESRDSRTSLSPKQSPQHSPRSSPHMSPGSSPRALRRQSPIEKSRVSPARSKASSRAASVESGKSNSASPPRQVPLISVKQDKVGNGDPSSSIKSVSASNSSTPRGDDSEMYEDIEASPKRRLLPPTPVEEPCTAVQKSNTEGALPLIQDNIYSTIPEMYQNFPKGNHLHEENGPELPPRPHSMKNLIYVTPESDMHVQDIENDAAISDDIKVSETEKPKPAYTEIPILEGPEDSSSKAKDVRLSPGHQKSPEHLTPKSKRKWLRSPRFGRRKSSNDDKDAHSEGGSSDREKEEKKNEGFMKRIGKIGSRSSKERRGVKRKSASADDTSVDPIPTYDSDSGASSSPEGSQDALTVPDPQGSRMRSSTESVGSEQLKPEVIPRSSSYSPAASAEVGYALTTRKKLDASSQRIVSSDPALSDSSIEHLVGTQMSDQQVTSNPSLSQHPPKSGSMSTGSSSEQLLAKPSAVRHHRKSAPSPKHVTGTTPLSRDIRSLIDNLGDGLEFCEEYTKKMTTLPGHAESGSTCGSAPTGLRLPVPFDLNQRSQPPNIVSVGFKLPPDSPDSPDGSRLLANGVGSGERRAAASDSSTASEGEEQGSSEKEEEGDIVYPVESSLDSRHMESRNEIKRRLSENSEKLQSVAPLGADGQNPENLVVTSLMYADAVWDRVGLESDELSFRVGDVIEILDMSDDTWWQGNVQEKSGWFPSAFVRLRIAQDEEDDDIYAVPPDATLTGGTLPRVTTMPSRDPGYSTYGRSSNSKRRMTIRRKDSCQSMPRKLTPAEVRAKVVEEILNTERDYVKHLEDIIEGFLKKCRINTKLFDRETIETIFSNLESLFQFQVSFLQQLECRVDPTQMEDSEIGEVFVSCRDGFAVYSEYCNNHPHAVNEMSVLQKKEQYAFFFESCRLLRNLQNIPLEGFLLLPVQKICKYPLQLSELLKYTSDDHPDRPHVEAAVEAMRQVATHINESKRRLENIGRIGKWQESIDGWKGPDIVETSTEMVHSSELHKISKGHSQERHFFLFDNQLIYCKKDTIGGKLCYKGRLAMETCHITDLPDGQETHNGVPVKNAWKMDNQAKGKDYVIYAKSPEVKMKWMGAFRKEKERVAQDKDSGFHVSLKMKRAAAALCSANSRVSAAKRRKSFNKKQALKVNALSESVDSGVKHKVEGLPAREKKGKFSIMKQIF